MKTPFAPQGTPLIMISAVEPERPCFVSIPNLLTGEAPAHATHFTNMARMLDALMRFAPAPWRQYWAVNALTPEVQYLGEFADPSAAAEALEASGYLRREEMFVVNCTGAASLLVSGKELQAVYRHPIGYMATVCNNLDKTSRQAFFEAPEEEAQEMAERLFGDGGEQTHVVGINKLRKYEDPFALSKTYVATFQHSNRMFGDSAPWEEELTATSLRDAQEVAGLMSLRHPDMQFITVRLRK